MIPDQARWGERVHTFFLRMVALTARGVIVPRREDEDEDEDSVAAGEVGARCVAGGGLSSLGPPPPWGGSFSTVWPASCRGRSGSWLPDLRKREGSQDLDHAFGSVYVGITASRIASCTSRFRDLGAVCGGIMGRRSFAVLGGLMMTTGAL